MVAFDYKKYSSYFSDECDMRSNYVKCDTCKQAIHENSFEEHRKDNKCTSMQFDREQDDINKYIIELLFTEPIEGYDRCPLCSTLVNQNKWREHLMGDHPCVNNPRNKLGKSCKYLVNYLSIY